MASVAGNTVTLWKGYLYTVIQYPYTLFGQGGVAGSGVVFGALKADPTVITTMVRVTDHATFLTTEAAYLALMKTRVTVVDQFGESFTNTLVLGVHCFESSDTLGTVMTAQWTFLLASS